MEKHDLEMIRELTGLTAPDALRTAHATIRKERDRCARLTYENEVLRAWIDTQAPFPRVARKRFQRLATRCRYLGVKMRDLFTRKKIIVNKEGWL